MPLRRSFRHSKPFLVIILAVIVIVGVGGAYLMLNRPSLTSSYSTTTHVPAGPGNASTTVSGSNPSCPCLSEHQIQTILNDSATYKSHATINLSYEGSRPSITSANQNLASIFSKLPANVTSGITRGWFLSYNSNANATTKEAFQEQVLESSSSTAGFCAGYAKAIGVTAANVPGSHFNQSANGFEYSDIETALGPYHALSLVGCKGDYIVLASLITGNKGVSATADIASQISTLV